MKLRLDATLLVVALCACQGAQQHHAATRHQQERSPVPEGINQNFLSAEVDPDEWESRWEAESREVCANRDGIVSAIGIVSGNHVVDGGTGTGLFVAPFSRAVASNDTVSALDVAPAFVEHLAERCRSEGFANVTPVLSTERSLGLSAHSADVAFGGDWN